MEEKKKLKLKSEPDKEEEICLVKCFSCGKNYFEELMHHIKIKDIFEESYIYVHRELCEDCWERLKQVRFVKSSEQELKDIKKEQKEVKENE